MTPLEILKAARALITDPQRWTRDAYARDALGNRVESRSPHAVAWCASGAICAAAQGVSNNIQDRANEALAEQVGVAGVSISAVNDSCGHAYILAAYDRAIAKLEGRTQ